MKKNTLLIGGIGIATIAASLLFANSFNSDTEAKYSMNRESLGTEQNIDDLKKWLNSTMRDVETGEVITPSRLNQVMENYRNNQVKNLTVDWIEHGPDNVGGRTRAILVEHENQNIIWSGGVSGGLYKSTTDANVWFRVDNFPGNQFISSIEQDAGGNVYVATGSFDEPFSGNGLYVTPDGGATWELVPGTGNETVISRVAATDASSTIYFTTPSGLKTYTYGGTVENVTSYGGNGSKTLAYSMDGQVLVVAANNNATYVSTDWGQTFDNVSGNGPGELSQSGYSRIEYAISSAKNDGTYSIYAATTAANNAGQWISLDNGQTWTEHTPATGANITNGVIDYRDQGGWNNTVAFDPTDPERVIVGGIDLHEWKQQINNPPSGSWNKISIWFVSQSSPLYAHADQHELKWDKNGKLYIGNDGGIGVSLDKGETFYPANRGYNITQFYHVAYDRNGSVLGGTQDNGCLYNDHTNSTYQEFKEVSGGDGFSTEISFFNPDVFFTSSQYNSFNRTADGGQNVNPFVPNLPGYPASGEANGIYPFATAFHFAEYFDESSEDSVIFVPRNNFEIGDTVKVPSFATGDTILYPTPEALYFDDTLFYDPTLTTTEYEVVDELTGDVYDLGENDFTPFASASQNYPPAVGDTLEVFVPNGPDTIVVESSTAYNFYYGSNAGAQDTLALGRDTLQLSVAWDTITVQDPFQSWFVFYTGQNGGEIWGTRDAARFSAANPKWVRLVDGIGNGFTGSNQAPSLDFCWSEDLNHMFVTSGNGIYRVDGLGSAYSTDDDFEEMVDIDQGATATDIVQVASGSVQGIGINKNNPDDLVYTQGFNGSVRRSSNATSASPSFTNVGSQGGPAFYDIIIDREDSDILFASTFNGISVSEDGGATWIDVTPQSVVGTPCHEIRQSWRSWEEGNYRPGEIYVATYGRGIWSTDAVLSTSSNAPAPTIKESNISLEVYPNPSRYNSTLVVELQENDNMEIQFFNISGRMVKRIQKTNAMIGRNEVVFSAEDLPQGTYLIRVQSGNQVQTTKFMKM
jgi:hypothetical protein